MLVLVQQPVISHATFSLVYKLAHTQNVVVTFYGKIIDLDLHKPLYITALFRYALSIQGAIEWLCGTMFVLSNLNKRVQMWEICWFMLFDVNTPHTVSPVLYNHKARAYVKRWTGAMIHVVQRDRWAFESSLLV